MDVNPAAGGSGLKGHVAPHYLEWGARDYENAAEFIREFDEYERNHGSADPAARLPNFIVMSLPEDHTRGSTPGVPSMRAAVASNDYAAGPHRRSREPQQVLARDGDLRDRRRRAGQPRPRGRPADGEPRRQPVRTSRHRRQHVLHDVLGAADDRAAARPAAHGAVRRGRHARCTPPSTTCPTCGRIRT